VRKSVLHELAPPCGVALLGYRHMAKLARVGPTVCFQMIGVIIAAKLRPFVNPMVHVAKPIG
jgi:hypothetical protein